nr:probable receptor-like protein kinase At5g59700 [Tanacetum cinerariifolium]
NQQYERLEKFLIPLEIINKATNQCSEDIGEGGYGKVYKGKLPGFWENRTAAIKFLNQNGKQGKKEFLNELELISTFHHQNIIPFIGFCDEGKDMILVYEYAANGSLDKHLEKRNKMRHITWEQRLKICLGVARGVNYLHSGRGEENRVIHRDLKSANILLDDNMEAKICDFGMSRSDADNKRNSPIFTHVAGTQFYTDPNYIVSGILTKECDVYSLGVEIAYQCIDIDTKKRPTINTIIEKIEEALNDLEFHYLIECVTKDKGFILGKPIAAFTIYQCLLGGNCFNVEKASLSSWLIQKIDKQIK